jgi:hypothetical protein
MSESSASSASSKPTDPSPRRDPRDFIFEYGKVGGGVLLAAAFGVLIALVGYAAVQPLSILLVVSLFSVSVALPSASVLFVLSRLSRAQAIVKRLLVISSISVVFALFTLIETFDASAGIFFAAAVFVAGVVCTLGLSQ